MDINALFYCKNCLWMSSVEYCYKYSLIPYAMSYSETNALSVVIQ